MGSPKLPVPSFTQTVDKLKSGVKQVSRSGEELQLLYQLIDSFSQSNGVGEKLHHLLQHKSSQTMNWNNHFLEKWFLVNRCSIFMNSFTAKPFPYSQYLNEINKQFGIEFITKLIISVIEFRNTLKSGLNPENGLKLEESTLCLDQYYKMLGTCCIPGHSIDSFSLGDIESNDISIIISRLNRFYKLSLTQTQDINALVPIIQFSVEYVLSESISDTIPIGIFTSLPRDDWFTVFQLLDENALKSIIKSEFIVNIDHMIDTNSEDKESYYKVMGKQALHSDIDNVGNRWFDKTIQLMVALNKSGDQVLGTALCYEHSNIDGTVVIKLMEIMIEFIGKFNIKSIKQTIDTNIEELSLICGDNYESLKTWEQNSRQKYLHFIQTIDLEILEFKDYGKEFIKSVECSPDSWVQLAIALALYRLYGRVVSHVETISTRRFAFGRLAAVDSVCNEFNEFIKTPNIETLMNAINSHKKMVINAMNGKILRISEFKRLLQEIEENKWKYGFTQYLIDNPLTETDFKTIDNLFANQLLKSYLENRLATNSLSIYPGLCTISIRDSIKCSYNITDNQILFTLSSPKSMDNENCFAFKTQLNHCLNDLKRICFQNNTLMNKVCNEMTN